MYTHICVILSIAKSDDKISLSLMYQFNLNFVVLFFLSVSYFHLSPLHPHVMAMYNRANKSKLIKKFKIVQKT